MTDAKVSIAKDAASKKTGMTLAELSSVVQDAFRLDIDLDAIVHVTAGWSRQLQSIQIESGKSSE